MVNAEIIGPGREPTKDSLADLTVKSDYTEMKLKSSEEQEHLF